MTSKFTIIRDTREKVGHGWNFRATKYCEGQVKAALKTGDYSLAGHEDNFCIERKGSISEFANNLVEKRFWNELERMKEMEHKYIICEFPFSDICDFPHSLAVSRRIKSRLRVTSEILLSKLCDIYMMGIPVIFIDRPADAQRLALKLCKKVHAA